MFVALVPVLMPFFVRVTKKEGCLAGLNYYVCNWYKKGCKNHCKIQLKIQLSVVFLKFRYQVLEITLVKASKNTVAKYDS
jgi:hypothetical protein